MKALKTVGKVFLTIGVTLVGLLLLCIVVIYIMEKGPSETAKSIFVHSVNETSRMGFVSTMFLSKEEVAKIMDTGGIQELEEGKTNDTDLINTDNIKEEEKADITFEQVSGKYLNGYLLTIRDPSRVFCGTVPEFGYFDGMTIMDMIDVYNSNGDHVIGGVNGGDFIDSGTNNSFTAHPLGLVISEGEVKYAENGMDEVYHIVGFTNENKLVMGNMTATQALEMGIRDAIYCVHLTGPFLVMDGVALIEEVPDSGGGWQKGQLSGRHV